jgi:hypothetical protein
LIFFVYSSSFACLVAFVCADKALVAARNTKQVRRRTVDAWARKDVPGFWKQGRTIFMEQNYNNFGFNP